MITRRKYNIKNALEAAGDLLLPRSCMICGMKLLSDERHICLSCMEDLPLTYLWHLDRNPMADKFNEGIQKALDDGRLRGPERYAYACALFFYSDDAACRHIPHRIKYLGDTPAGQHFGRMLGMKMACSPHFSDVDTVIPVPLHWRRKLERGYNQADVIARGLAEGLDALVITGALTRTRYTKTQTRLEVEQKETNVKDAFCMNMKYSDNLLKVRHILLVDDIFTTGATLLACFTALRKELPPEVRISVATLGFVGH